MRRPLTPAERMQIEVTHFTEAELPGLANLLACIAFQMGMLFGGYPGAHARVVVRKEQEMETLRLSVDMTVPLEELTHE